MSNIINYGGKNSRDDLIETIVLNKGITIIDFYAKWCPACINLMPVLEELSMQIEDRIVAVNLDDYEDIARNFGIRSIPTLIIFKDKKYVETIVGGKGLEELKKIINSI